MPPSPSDDVRDRYETILLLFRSLATFDTRRSPFLQQMLFSAFRACARAWGWVNLEGFNMKRDQHNTSTRLIRTTTNTTTGWGTGSILFTRRTARPTWERLAIFVFRGANYFVVSQSSCTSMAFCVWIFLFTFVAALGRVAATPSRERTTTSNVKWSCTGPTTAKKCVVSFYLDRAKGDKPHHGRKRTSAMFCVR